jgi:peptidoglycan/LPS O-acetylase OafA/YrhL
MSPPEHGQPPSKRAAKRLRREQARKREEEQRRPLVRAAVICGSVALAGLATMAIFAFTGLGDAAIWVAGPSGAVVLLMVVALVAIERTKKRKKERLDGLGRVGLVFATITGLQLLTVMALLLAGLDEASNTVALTAIVPAVLAFGLLGSGLTRAKPGLDSNRDTVTMMNDISRHHWS